MTVIETPQKFSLDKPSPDINVFDVSLYALDMSLSKLKNLQDKLLGHPAKFAPKALFKDLQSPKVTIAAEIETPPKFSTGRPI